jgi:hypothetical protein
MRKIQQIAMVAAVALGVQVGVADEASAGTVVGGQVYIDTAGQIFTGALGSALHSADATQFIGCFTTGSNVYCQARNAAGTLVNCSSSNPIHLEVVKAMGDDSRLYVRYDAAGACTQLYVYNYSYWESR